MLSCGAEVGVTCMFVISGGSVSKTSKECMLEIFEFISLSVAVIEKL